jgi:hypothetical protein
VGVYLDMIQQKTYIAKWKENKIAFTPPFICRRVDVVFICIYVLIVEHFVYSFHIVAEYKTKQRKSEIKKNQQHILPTNILLTHCMCYCSQASKISHLVRISIQEVKPIVLHLEK